MQTHYRQEMNFTWEALEGAQNALNKLKEHVKGSDDSSDVLLEFIAKFQEALDDDLNTPKALAVVWELVKSDFTDSNKSATLLKMDEVLGLNLVQSSKLKVQSSEIPQEIQELVQQREELRKEKKFEEADMLREKIAKMGYQVWDKRSGKPEITKI